MIGYFDDLAAALRREDFNEQDLAMIATAHAMEIRRPTGTSSARLVRGRSG